MLDSNHSFNFNQSIPNLGECLMRIMIDEVERLLSNHQETDWLDKNFAQLVYDFSIPDSPRFRLLCTSPRLMDSSHREEYERCGFEIPTESALSRRETLDHIISQALNIPLCGGRLAAVDENDFVMTLDFAIKLVNINERVAANVPCIIEGETGAGKTFLTKMYASLINWAMACDARMSTLACLAATEEGARSSGFSLESGSTAVDRLVATLEANHGARPDMEEQFSNWLHQRLTSICSERSPIFQAIPVAFKEADTSTVIEFVKWVGESRLEATFFELNVHSSIQERDVIDFFDPIRALAQKLAGHSASVIVFLDGESVTWPLL